MDKLYFMRIKRENWKGTYVYTARDESGRLLSRITQSKTKLRKDALVEKFKTDGSFLKGVKTSRTKLTNVTETVILTDTTETQKRKRAVSQPRTNALYQVSGVVNGELLVARSSTTDTQKRQSAWTSFLERLAQLKGLNYDENEGRRFISQVKQLQEGWVFYART